MNQDLQHLKLLSIFHYVVGGIIALFSCFPIIHIIMGIVFIISPESLAPPGEPSPPSWFGWIFVVMGSTIILIGWTLAALVLAAGRFLGNQTHYTFCLVMAAIECACMPFGTVLGVFTIIVLMRESVKELFSTDLGSSPFAESQ